MTSASAPATLLVLAVLLTPAVCCSQFIGTPAADRAASLEILKPRIRDVDDSFTSSAILLSFRQRLSTRTALILELPISHLDYPRTTIVNTITGVDTTYQTYSYGGSHTQLTNPYAAIRWWKRDPSSSWFEIGIRVPAGLPSDADEAVATGLLSEVYRVSAFEPDVVSLRLAAGHRFPRAHGWTLTAGFGEEFLIPTRGQGGSTPFLTYRAGAEFDRGPSGFGLNLLGAVNVYPGRAGSLNNRMANQLEAQVGTWLGRWRPELRARVWLDEGLREQVPVVIGVCLSWQDQKIAR